ncbi:hypothetical protein I2I11_06635 [Pontibacter sp. 172403-2]|uniref:hypothetical protein n=1 Tax=Pontibacter rufus TaxID=2791028 RepID=UPI0018AF5BC4|nr:hypothetical protein [Pontibacter sp. 172403-2]MBF9252961.1 hypothetical protein [Pontibacter sp. 172403-2]
MKLIILLFAIVLGFGATVKKSASDLKAINLKKELSEFKYYPNLLPEVSIIAPRF